MNLKHHPKIMQMIHTKDKKGLKLYLPEEDFYRIKNNLQN